MKLENNGVNLKNMPDRQIIEDYDMIWSSIIEDILSSGEMSESAVNLWFSHMKLIYLDRELAVFTIENELKQQRVTVKFKDLIQRHIEDLLGLCPDIRIDYNPDDAPYIKNTENIISPLEIMRRRSANEAAKDTDTQAPQTKHELSQSKEEKDELDPLNIGDEPSYLNTFEGGEQRLSYNADYTFDNFIVGSSNSFAHAAAVAVAAKPASAYNPLFIYGQSGLGKTHLMYAITNKILADKPETNVIYVKGEEFTNQLIEAISTKSTPAFREKYRRADMLLIDDVQFIAGKISTQEEFFHTFNALYEDHKQIILTSDRPPKEMLTLEDRIKSRFECGLLADIQPPDLELRLAILKKKADSLDLDISKEVLQFLADNLKSNVRQIEGVIKKLSAIAFLKGTDITLDLVKSSVPEYLRDTEPVSDTVSKIIKITAEHFRVSEDDLIGTKRTRDIRIPRNYAMYIIRKLTPLSLPEIGQIFNRDHATIHSNISTAEHMLEEDAYAESEINEIIREIKS